MHVDSLAVWAGSPCISPGDTLHTDHNMSSLDPCDKVAFYAGNGTLVNGLLSAKGPRASFSYSLTKTMY